MSARDISLDALQLEQIGYWLGMWHAWSASSDRAGSGYAGVSAGFGMHRTSRQYDDSNGALDAAADLVEARAVDQAVRGIADPWRTALHVEARNIQAPARVWASARIDREELARITAEARVLLWQAMERACMTPE